MSRQRKQREPNNIIVVLLDEGRCWFNRTVHSPVRAAMTAALYVWLQGSDPECNGRDATHGTIDFAPSDLSPNGCPEDEINTDHLEHLLELMMNEALAHDSQGTLLRKLMKLVMKYDGGTT